jgi:transketolase
VSGPVQDKIILNSEEGGVVSAGAHRLKDLDELCINTIRTLAIDAVQKANSGHPGMPMGAAPMAYVLWDRFLRFNPSHPKWPNRDRFILSAGHGCMLLYALLHLTGYDLSLDQVKQFRQLGSITPGHPEYGLTPGVEATTGPLGQGFANGVGMAIAEKYLAAYFNRPGHTIIDYTIYALVSDGDLMEGVTSEAASLAGHLGLGNLVYLYDDNHISIEGSTDLTFSESVDARFSAYNWHVQRVDGNDLRAIHNAIEAALAVKNRPSIICCRTHIAFGSPNKQDSASAHGSPLGAEEVRLTKKALGWPEDAEFYIPEEALHHFREALERGREREQLWQDHWAAYAKEFSDLAHQWSLIQEGRLPVGWESSLPSFAAESGALATREASGKVLNAVAGAIPWLLGGSGDLAPSTDTLIKKAADFEKDSYYGRNLHFGVREHAMGAAVNGMAISGLIPFSATFLQFADYQRPAIRLAALSEYPSIFIFTHDSIGVGEDGPTHQPIEHLAALRAIPHLIVIRPADAEETVYAWRVALENRKSPTALILTRQKLPMIDRKKFATASGLFRGAYILAEADNSKPEIILIATGSEVSLALNARLSLAGIGIAVRVVSMPSWELFEEQPKSYRDAVLPPTVKARLAIEMASPMGWEKWVGESGDVLGINRFGASAPLKALLEAYGFTTENVVACARKVLGR